MSRKRYVVMLALVTIAGFLGGAVSVRLLAARAAAAAEQGSNPGIIEAQGLRLVDGQGRLRASVWVQDKDDEPSLTLWDHEGKPRAALRLTKGGEPALDVWGANGGSHASFGMVSGVPGLAVYHDGVLRAWLAVADGQPTMELWDASGRKVPSAP